MGEGSGREIRGVGGELMRNRKRCGWGKGTLKGIKRQGQKQKIIPLNTSAFGMGHFQRSTVALKLWSAKNKLEVCGELVGHMILILFFVSTC